MSSVALISSLCLTVSGLMIWTNFRKPISCYVFNDCQTAENSTEVILDLHGPDIQFAFFKKNNTPYVNVDPHDLERLKESGFDTSKPTKFIIHGFFSSIKEEIFQSIKDAYMQDDSEINIFGVDWSKLCKFEYITSLIRTRLVAEKLTNFILELTKYGVRLSDIHIIGHSLGAHIAGATGGFLTNKTGEKIGRITGLDPAAPGFQNVPLSLKLDSNDAAIVDVIHTYASLLSITEPLGDFDFYPNGGQIQPGCPDIHDIRNVAEGLQCNHARAYKIFAESIRNKNGFQAKKCNNVVDAIKKRCFQETNVHVGQLDSYREKGIYYVETRATEPLSLT